MENLAQYFRLVFYSTIIILPIVVIIYFLVKKNIFNVEDEQKKTNIINTIKKLFVFSLIVIPTFLILKVTSPSLFHKRIFNNNEAFINTNFDFWDNKITDSLKIIYINKSFDFLYNRYGEKIYYDDFKFDKYDTIEQKLCLYFLLNPDLTDSMKLELRNKIVTTQDLDKYLKK